MTITQRPPAIRRANQATRQVKGSDVALLGCAAAFVPLEVMANNPLDIGHPERILALVGLLWGVGLLVVTVLVRRGVRSTTAVSSVFLTTVLTMTGGPLLMRLGEPMGWAALLGLAGSVVFLISRLESHVVLSILQLSFAAFLISGPTIDFVRESAALGEDTVVGDPLAPIGMTKTPDVFVVVLDGYGGHRSLVHDSEAEEPEVVGALEDAGFRVPRSAWSAYPATRSSVPSLLDMSYPLESGSVVSATTERHLSDMLGGSNAASIALGDQGYELVMVESGWSGSRCGPNIDRCISAPLMDEAMFAITERTVAGPSVLGRLGYAFTIGAQHSMSWLRANAPSLSSDGEPSFVFAHVMAPHPPFFLDAACRTKYHADRSGVQFARPFDDIEARQAAYGEQTECLNDFIIDLSASIDPNDVLIFVGDHGTDQRNQMARDPASWSTEDLAERFNVFLAVRAGDGCSVGDPVMVPNILRRVLSCLSDDQLDDLEPRMFKFAQTWAGDSASEVLEVGRSEVSALVGP